MVVATIAALGMAVFYYALRPTDSARFKAWWRRGGRWVLLMIICATLISVIAVYLIFAIILATLVNSTNHLCNAWDSQANFAVGATFCWVALTVALALMI